MIATHAHPDGLDEKREWLLAHLLGDHDFQELPLGTPIDELQRLHRSDHENFGPPPAFGMFQWIGPRW